MQVGREFSWFPSWGAKLCLGLKEVHRAVMGKIEGHSTALARMSQSCCFIRSSLSLFVYTHTHPFKARFTACQIHGVVLEKQEKNGNTARHTGSRSRPDCAKPELAMRAHFFHLSYIELRVDLEWRLWVRRRRRRVATVVKQKWEDGRSSLELRQRYQDLLERSHLVCTVWILPKRFSVNHHVLSVQVRTLAFLNLCVILSGIWWIFECD